VKVKGKGKGPIQHCLHESDSRTEVLYNLGSGSNDTAQQITQPSIARACRQLDARISWQTYHRPNQPD